MYIGALCKATFKKDPTALAEGATALGQMDEVEIQRFTDFLKRFGCKHCKISGYPSMIIFPIITQIQQICVTTSLRMYSDGTEATKNGMCTVKYINLEMRN